MSNVGIQFPRAANLVLGSSTTPGQGIDLSNLRFTFQVLSSDVETPNIAYIRVYNLSDNTQKKVLKEFDSVVLQAGYPTNIAVIFKGTIKQFHRGKESNVDSYIDILAADGDLSYNFAFINQGLGPGTTPAQQLNALGNAMGVPVDPNAFNGLTGGILPRGKVLVGLCRQFLRDLADSQLARWSIQNGVLTLIPLTGVLPGQAIKVNSVTGMIGVPEATDNGIVVQMLLNPQVRIGGSIQINNKDITATIVREQSFPSYSSAPTLVASVTDDGIYRILVVEHNGDTRGQEWYTTVTCLSLNQDQGKVLPFG